MVVAPVVTAATSINAQAAEVQQIYNGITLAAAKTIIIRIAIGTASNVTPAVGPVMELAVLTV